MIVHVFLFYLI